MTLVRAAERSGGREGAPLVPPRSRRNMVLSAASALLYVVVFGMVTSYSAPASVDMSRPGSRFAGSITTRQIAWIASLPSLAAALGNAVSGYLSHRAGRRAALVYVSASYTASWLSIAYAPEMRFVYAGRLVSGFCGGVCAVAVPAYVVEVSSVEIRGLLTGGFQAAFALGTFLVLSLGAAGLRWSWLAVAGAALVVAAAALTCLVPESPAWLMRADRNVEAFQGLRFLRRDYDEAAREFQDISAHLAEEPRGGTSLRRLLADPRLYRPVCIAVSLMLFQQFSGINALMAYSVELLERSASGLDPSLAASLVALVQLLATGVACLLVDRAGRKALYVTSGIFVALSLCISGVYSFFYEKDPPQVAEWSWVPLFAFVTYVVAFSLGLGPVPFVVTPEMVPTHTRSFLLAIAQLSCSCFGFVATLTFDDLRKTLGLAGLYWTYAAFALLGSAFYWTLVPETKGRSLRDIHGSFSVPGHEEGHSLPRSTDARRCTSGN